MEPLRKLFWYRDTFIHSCIYSQIFTECMASCSKHWGCSGEQSRVPALGEINSGFIIYGYTLTHTDSFFPHINVQLDELAQTECTM